MNHLIRLTSLTLIAALVSNCASIVSKSQWPVAVTSNPSGLSFTITNRAGLSVHQGVTPATVVLGSSAGFFRGERYAITAKRGGRVVALVPCPLCSTASALCGDIKRSQRFDLPQRGGEAKVAEVLPLGLYSRI